jgi:SAM-dependent methyltransferase
MNNKLNLGCGFDKREGYHNVDNAGDADEIVDLASYPWPWENSSFVEIIAQDIIEHLIDTTGFMNECWRVMKFGGKLIIRTPSYDADFAHIDPTHVKFFHLDTWDFFDSTTDFGKANRHLTPFKWRILSKVKTENKNLEIELEKVL